MISSFAFGSGERLVALPDTARIVHSAYSPPLDDAQSAVRNALANPIATPPLIDIAKGKKDACVVLSDGTRPIPYREILPPLLQTLQDAGIPSNGIRLLVATGIHRPMTGEELKTFLGDEIFLNYEVENHFGRTGEKLRCLGTTESGVPLDVNEIYLDHDLKILTGLIEPHLLAGYSGGAKAILPGLCGFRTMRYMHGPLMIGHPKARNGIVEGNPFRAACDEVASIVGADFILNVTAGEDRKITGVFAGEVKKTWLEGVGFVRGQVEKKIAPKPDVVVLSAGGAPPDRTLYQSVKAFEVAADMVKPGGSIVVASACSEGAGSDAFDEILTGMQTPQDALNKICSEGFFRIDQWIVQHLCQAALHAKLYAFIPGISPDSLRRWFIEPVSSVEEGILKANEGIASPEIMVLPQGPRIVPIV